MFLTEYWAKVAKEISEHSKAGLILTSEVVIDARTDKIGLLKGTIVFLDKSKLFLTEYLDLRHKIVRLSYAFHYQDKNGNLIFRYDNAAHKPKLKFREHKHTREGIVQSETPDITNILEEIMVNIIHQKSSGLTVSD